MMRNEQVKDNKKVWEAPKMSYLGDVEELVQTSPGGGKISVTNADPGEPKKTRPSEP